MSTTTTTTTNTYVHEGTAATARWTGSALLVETARPVSLDDLRAISEWAHDIEFRLVRDSTPVPATVCPDWCTASTSIDPWIRDRHEWTFGGIWTRVHHGPVGKAYNEQFEMSEPGGGSRRNRVVRGCAPQRRELRDGYWRVLA